MMLKQTKIVASISDQRCEVEFIRDLFKAGMNVVRMNTAHASREGFEKLIRIERKTRIRPGRYQHLGRACHIHRLGDPEPGI